MINQNSTCNSEALKKGNWVKLICGASNQDLPAINDLCSIYAAAGVHCIDLLQTKLLSMQLAMLLIGFSKLMGKNLG